MQRATNACGVLLLTVALTSCSAITGWGFTGSEGDGSVGSPDGGRDGGRADGGPIDGGPTDGGPTDGGPTDGGPTDAATLPRRTLTITLAGDGMGRVVSDDGAVDCAGSGTTCTATFEDGAVVRLTATPTGAATFAGWAGACSGAATCAITMDTDRAVEATFDLSAVSLLVTLAGDGTGQVTSAPAGIDCGTRCSASFDPGTVVTLSAVSDACSEFVGWSGACAGPGPCMIRMDASTAVTATFRLRRFTLTVSKTGAGTGTVTSSPAGIDCGARCTAEFACGESVSLSAAPSTGSELTSWGGACSGSGACLVTLNADRSVSASFGTCGAYGGRCCGSGPACTQGACLGGTCVTFGGSYFGTATDCLTGNGLSDGRCTCPDGFLAQRLEDADYYVDEGTGVNAPVHVCVAPTEVPGADFRGGYGEVLSLVGCSASCEPNRLTSACSCPTGATPQTFRSVHYLSGTTADCQRDLHLCRGTGTPLTYGGAYHQMDAAPTDFFCQNVASTARCEPNSVTGSCSCPPGFTANSFRILESRISGGSPGFCYGNLVICQRPPP